MKLSNIIIDGTSIQVGSIFQEPVRNDIVMVVKAKSSTDHAYNLISLENGGNYFTSLETLETVKYEITSKGFKPVLSVTISKN